MAEKIRYDVDINARDGVRELDRLGKAGKDAGKDLEKSFDDSATAADKAAEAIVQMATKMDTELRSAKEASDALALALGPELTGKMDVDQVVVDLSKMGLTFDEIRGDADKFATALREVDKIRVDQVNSGLDGMKGKLDNAEGAASGAKSALANMIGNSAQDISGLSSSLGVAIGQMAEYSADALLAGANSKQAFKDMALVAGPIAGLALLSAGVEAVKGSIDAWNKSQQAFVQQQLDFNDAVRQSGSQLDAVNTLIEDNVLLQPAPEMNTLQSMLNDLPVLGGMLDDTADSVDTVATSLATAGISQREWFEAMRVDIPGGAQRYVDLQAKLQDLADTGAITEDQFKLLSEQFVRQGQIVATNAVQTQAAAQNMAAGVGDITGAMQDNWAATEHTRFLWAQVTKDLADGTVDTGNAVAAWNELRDQLGLTNDEMAELTQQKLDEEVGAIGAAVVELGEAQREATAAALELTNSLAIQMAGFDEAAGRADALASALEGVNEASDLSEFEEISNVRQPLTDLIGSIQALKDAGADLATTDFVPDTWTEVTNMPEELEPVVAAFKDLREGIQSEMVEAFEHGGAAELTQWARDMRTEVVSEIEGMGLEAGEQAALIQQTLHELGLTDEQINLVIATSGQDQARAVLDSLSSMISGFDPTLQLAITAQMQTDPLAALQMTIDELEKQGVSIPTSMTLLVDQLEADVAGVEAEPVTLTAEAETGEAVDDLDEAADDRTAKVIADPDTDEAQSALDGLMSDKSKGGARVAPVIAHAEVQVAELLLNIAARDRIADIFTMLHGEGWAESVLNNVARDRTADIYVQTHGTAGASASVNSAATPSTAGVFATTAVPAPAAATAAVPVTPVNVTINAAVVGNRFDVMRTVADATRSAIRIAGRRQILPVGGRNP
jgi:hypothetical protein